MLAPSGAAVTLEQRIERIRLQTSTSEYQAQKSQPVPIEKVYVHCGYERIYPGIGKIEKGGGIRVKVETFGPQRDPFERLDRLIEMAENFRDYKFEPGHLAADDDGDFEALDCGGRTVIAHILGFATLEGFVNEGLATDERARRFREHARSRIALGRVQDFLAQVAEGDDRCVAIYRALSPNYKVKKSGQDTINSIKALYNIYDNCGVAVLKRAAQLAAASWRPKFKALKGGKRTLVKRGYKVEGLVFVALANVLEALPEKHDEKRLRDILLAHAPEDFKEAAHATVMKMAERSKSRKPEAVLKMLTQHMMCPIAAEIARKYNAKLSDEYEQIEVQDLYETDLAHAYTKTRNIDDKDND